jgi:hypothetical protein
MTDWKARCAELVDAIGSLVGGVHCGHYQQRDMWKCREIFNRIRAELDQPEPKGLTDEELTSFATEWWASFAYLERGADEATPINTIIHSWHFVDFLKDAIASLPIGEASDQ